MQIVTYDFRLRLRPARLWSWTLWWGHVSSEPQRYLCVSVMLSEASSWSHWGLLTPYGDIDLVNTGSGNGLSPDGTKPLPEPVLTYHQWSLMAFIWGLFHRKCLKYITVAWVWIILYHSHISQRAKTPHGVSESLQRFKDSNAFIHQNYMISTWIDTLTFVLNNSGILSMSPFYNRWYGDPY